jgi:hypothetical protein
MFSFSDMRLSEFPFVIVRLTCGLCPRRGSYRLARLAAKYGPETELAAVVNDLSRDCPYWRPHHRRPPRKYEVRCCARLEDVATPPDLPVAARRERLHVIKNPASRS